ncbi:MAG: hypothetical protein OSB38_42220, partial [Paraburkholderia fungorum]|nr:hypothetical protein [Paraburkholderia fungorum]
IFIPALSYYLLRPTAQRLRGGSGTEPAEAAQPVNATSATRLRAAAPVPRQASGHAVHPTPFGDLPICSTC